MSKKKKVKNQNLCMVLFFNLYLCNTEKCNQYHSIAEKFSFLLMYIMFRLDHNNPRYQRKRTTRST